jgi:hypothetical protein
VGATSVNIDGTQVYYCERKNWDTKVFPAAKGSVSGTIYVDHDSKGEKSIYVSFTTAIYVGATSTYGGTWYLDNIPRQATVDSANDFTDVDNPTITFSNPGNFPINARLEFAGISIHKEEIANTGSYTFNLTEAERELLRQKCIGHTMPIRFVIGTKINSTTETNWHWEDKTFYMTENEATKPIVSIVHALDNNSLPSKFDGMLIQGKTRLRVNVAAQGKYSANILGFSANIGGEVYNSDTIPSFSYSFLSNVISKEGKVDVIGYAKDSRGFTGFDKYQIEVTPYSKPLVIPLGSETAIFCYRSDGNGKRVGNSTSVWIKAKRFHYSLSGKNQCALQWRKKLVNEVWDDNNIDHKWKDLIPKTNTTNDEYNALLSSEVFELKKSYTIQIMAIDDFGERNVKTFEIPTQDVALHLGKGGKNVSVGTYCDYSKEHTFYSEWDAYFDKDVYIGGDKVSNSVVEEGTSGVCKYRKWSDGTAELWGLIKTTYANGSILGGALDFPFILNGYVYGLGTLNDSGGNSASALSWNLKLNYGTDSCIAWVHNPGGVGFTESSTADVSVYIVGRWK